MTSYIMRATFAAEPLVRIEPDMTVSEVLHLYPATERLFVACGIDTGCGLPLADVAHRHVLQVPELLRALTRAAERLP